MQRLWPLPLFSLLVLAGSCYPVTVLPPEAICGNGALDLGEACDDGPLNSDTSPDACRTDCQAPTCGDNVVDSGEVCDPPDGVVCDVNCQFVAGVLCGNGAIDPGEECDDNNVISGDGCSSLCQEEFCGDGVVQFPLGEECDDGNNESGDGCDENCVVEFCGDGIINNVDEECDDNNAQGGDGCDENCLIECGNGVLDENEECDDGNTQGGDGCEADCTFTCGSGIAASARAFDPQNNHCYLQFNNGRNWVNAQGECVDLGGNLVTIGSAEENTLVRSLDPDTDVWIGLNDRGAGNEGDFVWVSGEPVVFTNFAEGEPNNRLGEDCVHIRANADDWNDLACSRSLPYVCEIAL